MTVNTYHGGGVQRQGSFQRQRSFVCLHPELVRVGVDNGGPLFLPPLRSRSPRAKTSLRALTSATFSQYFASISRDRRFGHIPGEAAASAKD